MTCTECENKESNILSLMSDGKPRTTKEIAVNLYGKDVRWKNHAGIYKVCNDLADIGLFKVQRKREGNVWIMAVPDDLRKIQTMSGILSLMADGKPRTTKEIAIELYGKDMVRTQHVYTYNMCNELAKTKELKVQRNCGGTNNAGNIWVIRCAMTYDELVSLYRIEKNNTFLPELPVDFYAKSKELIVYQKEKCERVYKDAPDSLQYDTEMSRYRHIIDCRKKIIDIRMSKILSMAERGATGANNNIARLTPEEATLYMSTIDACKILWES